MPATNLTIAIERETDAAVLEKIQAIASELSLAVQKITIHPVWSDQNITVESANDSSVQEVLQYNSVLNKQLSFQVSGISFRINRSLDGPNPLPYDTLSIHSGDRNQAEIAKAVIQCRSKLRPLDLVSASTFLTDAERQFASSQRVEIERLKEMQLDFFKKFEGFTAQEASRINARLAEIDLESTKSREEIERQKKAAIAEVEHKQSASDALRVEKEKALDAKMKAFETRESKFVRRDQFTEFIKGKTADAAKKRILFGESTTRRQMFVAGGFALLLLFFALQVYGVFEIEYVASRPAGADDAQERHVVFWFNSIRRIFGAVGCVVTIAFFVKWLNALAVKYSGQDLHEIAFSEDFMRANWLMEIASEWRDANQEQIPEYVVERLSRNLFTGWKYEEPEHTTAIESIGSALKGASVKIADVEIVAPGGKKESKPTKRPTTNGKSGH